MSNINFVLSEFITSGCCYSLDEHDISVYRNVLLSLQTPPEAASEITSRLATAKFSANMFWKSSTVNMTVEETAQRIPLEQQIFFSLRPPMIDLASYIHRICTYMRCSAECFIIALVLLRRACKIIPLTSRSMHRLFGAVMVIAAKMHDDRYYPMSYYASVCGTTIHEMNVMEVALMGALDWNATVSVTEYVMMLFSVRSMCWAAERPQFVDLWANDILSSIMFPTDQSLMSEHQPVTANVFPPKSAPKKTASLPFFVDLLTPMMQRGGDDEDEAAGASFSSSLAHDEGKEMHLLVVSQQDSVKFLSTTTHSDCMGISVMESDDEMK